MKKIFLCFAVLAMMLVFRTTPAMAEERSVFGFNLPFSLSYEKEYANNYSWIINGLIYVDNTFTNYDISLFCYSGVRFYQGAGPGRIYEGIYGYCSFKGVEAMPSTIESNLGAMGIIGYEYRFGTERNMRVYVEGGLLINDSGTGGVNYNPALEAGLGFEI